MRNKKSKIALTVGAIALAAIILTIAGLASGSKNEDIVRTGQIELREYDVASKIPGRIESLLVDEGDFVSAGQPLFRLTDREVRAKEGQAAGATKSARAQFDLALAGARAEQIEAAQRGYEAAQSALELAQKTYNRMKSLHEDKLLSDQEFDAAFQRFQAATAQAQAARSTLDMARNGARSQEKTMAQGQYERAISSLEEAKAYVDESYGVAPASGIIAKRYADPGELLAQGSPALTIVDPNDVWAELNLPETELKNLRIGMAIVGYVPALGRNVKFQVVNFSALSDFANWRTTLDKSNFEVRSFTVKLKPEGSLGKSVRSGMTVSFNITNPMRGR